MIWFTFSIGNWVIFSIRLFERMELESDRTIDLTSIGGEGNILADDSEDEELASKRRPCGFGRRN
jgi:hypothetical protein